MVDWKKIFPNSIVTWIYKGDFATAEKHRGDGWNLLYQLLNMAKFNDVKFLPMTRVFQDGTVIKAMTHFGYNTIEIDTTKSVSAAGGAAALRCVITLLYVPTETQPMRYPGEIHAGEVEDVDYLKIYYSFDLLNCQNCSEIQFEVLVVDCIYSLEHSCWGEIVESGEDVNGTYIIVKLFTEQSFYSRTGLADLQLRAFINKEDGTEACSETKDIRANCCVKDASLREVVMYWDHDCGQCETPAINSMYDLGSVTHFFTDPRADGGCIPFEWSWTGPGTLLVNSEFGDMATYSPPETFECYEDGDMEVRDRCNVLDTAHFNACCDAPNPLVIAYTVLVMACSQSQDLAVTGGCPPYSWTLSDNGGGTLVVAGGIHQSAIYTAPSINPSCVDNPTIIVTDCCGTTAQLRFAVNCYYDPGASLINQHALQANCWWDAWNNYCYWTGDSDGNYYDYYNCTGTLYSTNHFAVNTLVQKDPGCATHIFTQADCNSQCALGPETRCAMGWQPSFPWGLTDMRTADQLARGCCPINPFTGLPWT